jgi:hypothetical protein
MKESTFNPPEDNDIIEQIGSLRKKKPSIRGGQMKIAPRYWTHPNFISTSALPWLRSPINGLPVIPH